MKPSYVKSWEFLPDIAAGNGMKYLLPRSTPRSFEELVGCYYSSDHYQDIIRVIGTSKEFSTYWVESEPGIGLSLRKPTTFNSNVPSDVQQEMGLCFSCQVATHYTTKYLFMHKFKANTHCYCSLFTFRSSCCKAFEQIWICQWGWKYREHPSWWCGNRNFHKWRANAVSSYWANIWPTATLTSSFLHPTPFPRPYPLSTWMIRQEGKLIC